MVVVPVVMAKSGVVMNGSLTVEGELIPESWNGVPVTVGHPEDNKGAFQTANDPGTLTEWAIGRIFNATVEDGALKGEAWLEIDRANNVAPGLIKSLERGEEIDVSTGYFCVEDPVAGQSNGREFNTIARNINPDHLALLPNEQGACSWADGCGVRFNSTRRELMKLKDKVVGAVMTALGLKGNADKDKLGKAVESALKGNERGNDDDRRQIIADLISNDASPFVPDDEDSLKMMSDATLKHQASSYLKAKEEAPVEEEEEEPTDNEGEEEEEVVEESSNEDEPEEEEEKKDVAANRKKRATANADAIQKAVDAAVTKAIGKLLTNEDRAALASAKKSVTAHRDGLVKKIVANSTMKAKDLTGFSVEQLELIANNQVPTANYGGRALPEFNADDSEAEAMVPPSAREIFANRGKARKEAH
ncbi:MAG: DUF2213 domain-containing protein [Phycisphaerales bacterium]